MPTPTYTPLANITLGSPTATITFSSISQSYRDLILVANSISGSSTVRLALRFNGDSSSSYFNVAMIGDGASVLSSQNTTNYVNPGISDITTTNPSTYIANIMDYSATDKHKITLVRSGGVSLGTTVNATRWGNTAAINNIAVTNNLSVTFAAGSTFALYGVAA